MRPALLKQSTPITMTVAPAKEIDAIRAYGRVQWLIYSAKPPTVKRAINMILPVVDEISPPDFRTKNHILRQKPPKKHASPSVISAKITETPPAIIPVTHAATKKAPCMAIETGGLMTYTMRMVTPKLAR